MVQLHAQPHCALFEPRWPEARFVRYVREICLCMLLFLEQPESMLQVTCWFLQLHFLCTRPWTKTGGASESSQLIIQKMRRLEILCMPISLPTTHNQHGFKFSQILSVLSNSFFAIGARTRILSYHCPPSVLSLQAHSLHHPSASTTPGTSSNISKTWTPNCLDNGDVLSHLARSVLFWEVYCADTPYCPNSSFFSILAPSSRFPSQISQPPIDSSMPHIAFSFSPCGLDWFVFSRL